MLAHLTAVEVITPLDYLSVPDCQRLVEGVPAAVFEQQSLLSAHTECVVVARPEAFGDALPLLVQSDHASWRLVPRQQISYAL